MRANLGLAHDQKVYSLGSKQIINTTIVFNISLGDSIESHCASLLHIISYIISACLSACTYNIKAKLNSAITNVMTFS